MLVFSNMCTTALSFSGVLLIFISFIVEATSVKLIPNGSKTTYKDGVTHQISKYIVMPEDNDVIYENNQSQSQILGQKLTSVNDKKVNLYNIIQDSGKHNERDSGSINMESVIYNGHNHRNHPHQGDERYSGSQSYTSSSGKNTFVTGGNGQSSGGVDLTVHEEALPYRSLYQIKSDKSIDGSYGESVNQEHLKSHNNHYKYETGGIANKDTYNGLSKGLSNNLIINKIEGNRMIAGKTNFESVLHQGDGDHLSDPIETYDIRNNNDMLLTENDDNINRHIGEKTEQSSDWTLDKEYNIDTNSQNVDADETEKYKEIKKTLQQNNDKNKSTVTNEEVPEVDTTRMPDVTNGDDGYDHGGENRQDIASGDKVSELSDLRSVDVDNSYPYADKAPRNHNAEVIRGDSMRENYQDFINTDFDYSYPELESDTSTETGYNDHKKYSDRLPFWRSYENNLRLNGLDNLRDPYILMQKTGYNGDGLRKSDDYFYLDDYPPNRDDELNERFKMLYKLQDYGRVTNTGSDIINKMNSEFNPYETDKLYATTNNVNAPGTNMQRPVKSSHLSIMLNLLSKFDQHNHHNYKNRFVINNRQKYAIENDILQYILTHGKLDSLNEDNGNGFINFNGEKHDIDENILKYILSHGPSHSLNEQSANRFVIINGEKHAIDDNILKYIRTHKQLDSLNEENFNEFVYGKKYTIDDNIFKYILTHEQSNALDKEPVAYYEGSELNKINLAYLLRNLFLNDDTMVGIRKDEKNNNKDFESVNENRNLNKIYQYLKSINLLDNQDQVTGLCFGKQVMKNIMTETPRSAWVPRYEYTNNYNVPDSKNLLEQYITNLETD